MNTEIEVIPGKTIFILLNGFIEKVKIRKIYQQGNSKIVEFVTGNFMFGCKYLTTFDKFLDQII